MIERNIVYKGVSLAESAAVTNRVLITGMDKGIKLRTEVFNRQNYHGSYTSGTLAEGRLFSVSGVIFGTARSERGTGQALINSIIVPESIPSAANRGFYELSYTDDLGVVHVTQAKVYSAPRYEPGEPGSPDINFTFELYAETATTTASTEDTETGGLGAYSGFTLPVTLPAALDGLIGEITVVNDGNFAAGITVTVTGSVDDPKIHNVTSGQMYGLTGVTTTDLVFDSTGASLTVEDAGVDVTGYRLAGSASVFLDPGTNTLVITGANFPDATITVEIAWRDTFMAS